MKLYKEQLTEAVNYLILTRNYAAQVAQIKDIIAHWDKQRVFFPGDRECLNSLISVGLLAPDKLEKLWQLIETKRREQPGIKRNDYQRGFMRQYRARLHRALEIDQQLQGRPFTPDERAERLTVLKADWTQRRAQYLAKLRHLDWKTRTAALQAFWAGIDAELDALEKQGEQALTPAASKSRSTHHTEVSN